MARCLAVEQPPHYLGSGPGGPPGVPAGGITGMELGCGTGAGCTIFGSTPSAGLMTPPLLSNLSLRLWFPSEVAFSFFVPPSAARAALTDAYLNIPRWNFYEG